MIIKQTSAYMANEPVILLYPSLAHTFGVNGALIIQQIRWWMAKYEQIESPLPVAERMHCHDGRWWIYNTYDEWQKSNFSFWSKRTIERLITALEQKGVVLSGEFNRATGDRTKWYTLDFDVLDRLVAEKMASIAPGCATDPALPEPDSSPESSCIPGDTPPSRQLVETITTTCRDHHDNLTRSIYKDSKITSKNNQQRSQPPPPPAGESTSRARADPELLHTNGGGESPQGFQDEILRLIDSWNVLPDLQAAVRGLDPPLLLAMIWSVKEVQGTRNPAGLLHKRVCEGWHDDRLLTLAEIAVKHGLVERARAVAYYEAERLGQL